MNRTQKLLLSLVYSLSFALFICLIFINILISTSVSVRLNNWRSLIGDSDIRLVQNEAFDSNTAEMDSMQTYVAPIITLTDIDLYPCRVENEKYLYWGTVALDNNSQDFWYNGSYHLKFLNSKGDEIGVQRGNATIPPNTESLVAHDKLSRNAYVFELTEPNFDSIILEHKTDVQIPDWNPIDNFHDGYSWQSEIISHTTNSDQYPKHTITIRITNTGIYKLHRVMGFAAVYNSNGEIADILWSEPINEWPYGKSIRKNKDILIKLTSLAVTGACIAPFDKDGYTIEYQLTGITARGYPLQTSTNTNIP